MKTLIAIWIAVVIASVTTVGYINAEINKMVQAGPTQSSPSLQETASLQVTQSGTILQPANVNLTATYNAQETIDGSQLQSTFTNTNLRIAQ
ncbi:hypothetical protein UFOVP1439_27 [uncultured Caudovirales phage]|uniref:Uncharacterized protein n=1 Tax=uncultured Caudovirales phage TaxID=2100421 RepID=A0A6J5QE55_9CAUD|nr:hypothetical protein UFOVP1085_7 [uncultured Caudovirales phage]CAB4212610.1 hypothetical protein UFOVP1439_27 [uncultured Caudovirales phage]